MRKFLCKIGIHKFKPVYRYCDDEVGRFFGPVLDRNVCLFCGKVEFPPYLHIEGD